MSYHYCNSIENRQHLLSIYNRPNTAEHFMQNIIFDSHKLLYQVQLLTLFKRIKKILEELLSKLLKVKWLISYRIRTSIHIFIHFFHLSALNPSKIPISLNVKANDFTIMCEGSSSLRLPFPLDCTPSSSHCSNSQISLLFFRHAVQIPQGLYSGYSLKGCWVCLYSLGSTDLYGLLF